MKAFFFSARLLSLLLILTSLSLPHNAKGESKPMDDKKEKTGDEGKSPKRSSNNSKGRGNVGETAKPESDLPPGKPLVDPGFRPKKDSKNIELRDIDDVKKSPAFYVDLSLESIAVELVQGDEYRLEVVVKNNSKQPYVAGGVVVFSRTGFGEELPSKPGGKIADGPKRGHKKLGEKDIPEIDPGKTVKLSLKVNNLCAYYAHIELPKEKTNLQNLSRKTRVEEDLLKSGGTLPINLDLLLETFGMKDSVSNTKIRLNNGKGSVEIDGLIEKQTFDIPDGPLEFLGTQIDYFVNDIDQKKVSMKFAEKEFQFVIELETRDPEVKVGGNNVTDAIYPDVETDELKISVRVPLKFDKQRQLFELGDAKVDVDANWSFQTVPGLKELLDTFLKDVNSEIENQLEKTFDRDISPVIAWNLNNEIREKLLPLDDRYGNVGQITDVDIENDGTVKVSYKYPY